MASLNVFLKEMKVVEMMVVRRKIDVLSVQEIKWISKGARELRMVVLYVVLSKRRW